MDKFFPNNKYDEIIDELKDNKSLIKFISKNLSFGIYNNRIPEILNDSEIGVKELFLKGIKDNKIKIKNPEVTLYMIIELVGSTCPSAIMNNSPLPIDKYKPYLYQ